MIKSTFQVSIIILVLKNSIFETAMHGLGFVLESNLLTQNYLDSGKLVRAFANELSIPISAHHLVYPRTHQFTPKIELFLNWILD